MHSAPRGVRLSQDEAFTLDLLLNLYGRVFDGRVFDQN